MAFSFFLSVSFFIIEVFPSNPLIRNVLVGSGRMECGDVDNPHAYLCFILPPQFLPRIFFVPKCTAQTESSKGFCLKNEWSLIAGYYSGHKEGLLA
jgi:hypothetical protein